jgi:acetyl-CoA acetyltransferase
MVSQFCFVFKPEILFSGYLITTGVSQVVELMWQLRGEADKRQVDGAETGITCNFGGFGNNIISILVERL